MRVLHTIGFTKKSAEEFFDLLRSNGVTLVADVRLNNTGQLAGFTKARDLEYFLSLFDIKYQHWKAFAPTKELRKAYHGDWDFDQYAESYKELVAERGSLDKLSVPLLTEETVCLLCSEATHEKCHRRIAADLIDHHHPNLGLEVKHL